MIRIIDNPNPSKEITTVCKRCHCKFGYLSADIRNETWNNGVLGPGFYGYNKSYVSCPNCGNEIILTETSSASTIYGEDITPVDITPEDILKEYEIPNEISVL